MSFARLQEDPEVAQLPGLYYKHPFNIALLESPKTIEAAFDVFVEQDALYLKDFYQALLNVANRLPQYKESFKTFAKNTVDFEKIIHEKYLKKRPIHSPFHVRTKKNLAIVEYTRHLLKTTCTGSIGEALACLLPCFWLYNEAGKQMSSSPHYNEQHPHYPWIRDYASPEFSTDTDSIINIFNKVTLNSSETEQQRIKVAFMQSAFCEFEFLESVYKPKPALPCKDFSGLEKLDKHLAGYEKHFGTTKPVHTGFSMLDDLGNTLASWVGVKVNQERVKEGRDIIAGARAALAAHTTTPLDKTLEETIKKLQNLHRNIIKKTSMGETTRHLVTTLHEYGSEPLIAKKSYLSFMRSLMVWKRRVVPLKSKDLTNNDNATHKTTNAIPK